MYLRLLPRRIRSHPKQTLRHGTTSAKLPNGHTMSKDLVQQLQQDGSRILGIVQKRVNERAILLSQAWHFYKDIATSHFY